MLAVLPWALFAALSVATLLAVSLGLGIGGSATRIAGLWAIAAAFALPLLGAAVLGWNRYRRLDRVAAVIERVRPEFRTDLRTILDFAQREAGSGDTGDLQRSRRELRHRLHRRVTRLFDEVAPAVRASLPRPDHRPAAIATGALLLLIAASVGLRPGTFGEGWRAIALGVAGPSEAEKAPMRPIVGAIDMRVDFPAYTGLPSEIRTNTTGDVDALLGSEIELRAHMTEPVESVSLVFESGDRVEPPLALRVGPEKRTATGSVAVIEGATYRFRARLPSGETVVDPITRRIRAEEDRAPTVQLNQPSQNLEVSPDDVVDFGFTASDDFGLTEVSLVWHFANDAEDERTITLHGVDAGRGIEDQVPFELAPLALQPGDEVVARIDATDNDAYAGPKTGHSRAVSLRVRSPRDRHREVMEMERKLFDDLLGQLASMLSNALHDFTADSEEQEIVFHPLTESATVFADRVVAELEIHEAWAPILDLFRQLLAAMEEDEYTLERELMLLTGAYETLYELERDEARLLERLERPARGNQLAAGQVRPLSEHNFEHVQTTERTILMLEDIVAEQQAREVENTAEELADIRERLQELMEQYRDTQDPALREQIEREMRRLAQRMQELLQQLQQNMGDLPYEHLNLEALEQSDITSDIEDMATSFEQIQQMLDSGDIDGALQALEQLGSNLESMMGQLGANMQNAGAQGSNEFDQRMSDLMDEVNNLELQEREIEEDTTELLDEMRRERQEQIREEVERRLREAMRQIDEMERDLAELSDDTETEFVRGELADAQEATSSLRQQLEREDIAGAEEQAMRLQSEMGDAERAFRRVEQFMGADARERRQAQEARRTVQEGEETAREIGRSMRELMEMATPRPSPSQQQQMQQLAEQQGQVQQQMQGLQRQLSEFGERYPMVQDQFGEPMQQSEQGMQQSGQQLRSGRPRPALQGQQQALQGLRQMRQQMQQMVQRQRIRGSQGRELSRDEVEIPEDQRDAARDFRQDIVEAMREGSLDSYQDEIERYYESLVE